MQSSGSGGAARIGSPYHTSSTGASASSSSSQIIGFIENLLPGLDLSFLPYHQPSASLEEDEAGDEEGDEAAPLFGARSSGARSNPTLLHTFLDDKRVLNTIFRWTFPIFPVAICLMLALVGHAASDACMVGVLGSVPVWYFVSLCVVVAPFYMLWGGSSQRATLNRALSSSSSTASSPSTPAALGADGFGAWSFLESSTPAMTSLRLLFTIIGGCAMGIALFESVLAVMLESKPIAWAAGYSLYSMLGLIAAPLFFFNDVEKQEARLRHGGEGKSSSSLAPSTPQHHHHQGSDTESSSVSNIPTASPAALTTQPSRRGSGAAAGQRAPAGPADHGAPTPSRSSSKLRQHNLKGPFMRRVGSHLAMISAALAILLSLGSAWSRTLTRPSDAAPPWFWQAVVLYLLVPVQAAFLFFDPGAYGGVSPTFNFAYAVFYSVLGMRVPDYLAFAAVRLFNVLGDEDVAGGTLLKTFVWAPLQATAEQVVALTPNSGGGGGSYARAQATQLSEDASAPAASSKSNDVARLMVSFGYLAGMSLYTRFLRRLVQAMSAKHAFPRFQFHSQITYYATYYVLVASVSRELDFLFWAMVFAFNLYYVLLNTGVLEDAWTAMSAPLKPFRPPTSPMGGDSEDDKRAFVYRIALADQDALADVTSLIAVPTLISAFAVLAKRDALHTATQVIGHSASVASVRVEHVDGAELDIENLWSRFFAMFVARLISSIVSRSVFRLKVRRMVAEYFWNDASAAAVASDHIENVEVVLDSSVGKEFRQAFWYYVLVTVYCMYSLFQNPNLPSRYAFCSMMELEYSMAE